MSARHMWKLGPLLILGIVALGALLPATAGAQPGPQAVAVCPVPISEVDQGVEVCVDRGEGALYFEGDPIRICVTANIPVILIFPPPPPPLIRVTDQVDGHPPRVIFEDHFFSGQRCIDAVITAPFGRETIRAEAINQSGQVFASDSTFFFSAPRNEPPPHDASITVDRGPGGVYTVGDPIRICYDVPGPGPITITDVHADGTQHVLLSGNDDGTGGCFNGTVTPPAGTECLRLDYHTSAGSGTTQVCFQVVGSGPAPGNAFISTDRSLYRAGDPIRICYDVPGPGPITITSLLPGGGSRVVLSGYEDGAGGCVDRTLGPETGIKCLRLEYNTSGGSGSRQTCFRVTA